MPTDHSPWDEGTRLKFGHGDWRLCRLTSKRRKALGTTGTGQPCARGNPEVQDRSGRQGKLPTPAFALGMRRFASHPEAAPTSPRPLSALKGGEGETKEGRRLRRCAHA